MKTAESIWLKHTIESGVPTADLFEIRKTEIDDSKLGDGELFLQILVLSVDPYQRGQLRKVDSASEGPKQMTGFVSGKVIASNDKTWKVGDLFGASLPLSTFVKLTKEEKSKTLMWKLNGYLRENEIEKGCGIFGMPGCTAYAGTIDILKPQQGQTLFVSAASGAVGSLVSQIAKCHTDGKVKVIGSCGSEDKVQALKKKFKYDETINYKEYTTKDTLSAKLKECSSPSTGIDMYFENVGGIHFDAALENLNEKGRIAICGTISTYNEKEPATNAISPFVLLYKQAYIEGFVCGDWLSGKRGDGEWLHKLSKWKKEGRLNSEETIVKGVDKWAETFCSLFTGSKHLGKLVVKV